MFLKCRGSTERFGFPPTLRWVHALPQAALFLGLLAGCVPASTEALTPSDAPTYLEAAPTAVRTLPSTRTPPPPATYPTPHPPTSTATATSLPVLPTQSLPAGTPILDPGGSGAATDLAAEVGCTETAPREGFAKLRWRPASDRGREQRVVVTIYRDGFENNLFAASEPLKPDEDTLVWQPLSGQAIHFWRVLTLHDGGWVPSEIIEFVGLTCAADYPSP